MGLAVNATIDGGGTELPIAGSDALTGVAITGGSGTANAPVVSDTLTATPSCTVTCGAVTYQWQVEDAPASGNYTNIAGATSSTWQVSRATQKRKVQVVVSTPVAP